MELLAEDERNRETKQENTKPTEELTQIRKELRKYKTIGDDGQYLEFLEDLWAQRTEISSSKSDIRLYLQSELAHTYFRLHKFNTSQNFFQELLDMQRRVLGEEDSETLRTESFLGRTYESLKQYDKALAVFQEVLDKQRRVLGEEHSETLQTEFLLGVTYESLEQYDKALAVFQEVLDKQRRVLGEEHSETLQTEFLLGVTYESLEQYDKALAVSQELLDKQRRVLGEEHSETLETEFLLGVTYESLEQYDKAFTVSQKLLDRQRRVLGEEHPETLETEFLLGRTYESLEQYDKALAVSQELLDKQRRILGEEHPETLETESLLGRTYGFLEQYDKALAVFQEVLDKQRRALGEDHPETLQTEFLLGVTYEFLDLYDKALAVFQKLLDKQRRVLGEEHPETLQTESLLGRTYGSFELYDKALAVFQKLLDKQRRVLDEDHPETLQTESLLGVTYESLEQYDKALAVFQKLLDKQRRVLGEEDSETLQTESLLGETYESLKQYEKALAVFQELFDKQRRVLGEEDSETLRTEFLLGNTYKSLKQYEKAFAVSQKLLDKQRRVLGEEHPETLQTELLLGVTCIALHKFDKVLAIFQELLDKQRRVLGEEDSETLRTEILLGNAYTLLEQYDKALTVFQEVLDKQRRALGEDHPETLQTEILLGNTYVLLKQYDKFFAVSQDHTNRSIESSNFKIPDYRLISRFLGYDFDFNRSRIYSEQANVLFVNPLESESSSSSTDNTKNNPEDAVLKIQNFLNLDDVQLNIKPITCIYGGNQVGKSNVSRLLYGFQHSSIKILKKLTRLRYSRRIISLSENNSLNLLKSELTKTRLSKDQHIRLMIPEKVCNLLVGRLSKLIEDQISEIPQYFYLSEKKWENLTGILNNKSTCRIHSSRSSFHCDIEVKKDEGKPSINLKSKSSFKIELELVYESNERNLKGASIFEVLYSLSSLRIHFSDRKPILIPLKKIKSNDNLKDLPILHHVMSFSNISYLSNQDVASSVHKEISEIINNPEIVSKEELDILDNRLVYLIYDSLLIELWKMSPFSFFTKDARYFPAERGGILERMPMTYALDLVDQEKTPKLPEGLREYGRFIQKSLLVSEKDKNDIRSKLSSQDQKLLREIESDLIKLLYFLELKVSQGKDKDDKNVKDDGASRYFFVKKVQKDGKEVEKEFPLGVLPSSVFSLFALNSHIRLSKLKKMLFYEEPETHLHPNSIRKLCDLFVKIYHNFQSGEEHSLAMFFTTHSGFFLDFLFIALERKYGLDRMKNILSVVRLFTDDNGGAKSEPIEVTKEGYSDSPFDEEDLMAYKALIDVYNKHTPDADNHWDESE